MVLTRAQSTGQKGCVSSVPKDQDIRTHKPAACDQLPQSPIEKTPSQQGSATLNTRGTRRPAGTLEQDPLDGLASNDVDTYAPINPIDFWRREGHWPPEYFDPGMERLLARKKAMSGYSRKRSRSGTSITTPSDQRPREEKTAPYGDPRYPTLLETKSSFMNSHELDVQDSAKTLVKQLLEGKQAIPEDSLFRDDVFKTSFKKIQNSNEFKVIQKITRLIVPSAEDFATFGAKHLDILAESFNEGWNNSIPLTGTHPQPDYSVGFRRRAFTDTQLAKLSPFLGEFLAGDQSLFMGTFYMYFPFLTCEVKGSAAALDVADCQNAHSMTLAVRAVAELFLAVEREGEVDRQLLAFSISHDQRWARIYGHYPVINGKDIKYYRHPIHEFNFTALDGKEKWTAYQFTKNVYDTWMPTHFKRICSAIDKIPDDLDFDNPSLPATGLPQNQETHHQSSNAGKQKVTPITLFADPKPTKRRKGMK